MDWESMKRSALKIRGSAASAVKDLVMTEVENKARSATADTSWRPSGSELDDLARASFHRDEYPLIMSILWQRLGSRRWRCVYKGLELLKYLCLHGSSRVVDEARDAINHLQSLESFRYVDVKTRKDEGQNVRNKAKALVELLEDEALLEEEQRKAKAMKSKLGPRDRDGGRGYGSDEYRGGRDEYDRYDDRGGDRGDRDYDDPAGGPPPGGPGLDDILGLSEGAGAVVPAGGAGQVLLIEDDDDFDPRGFAAAGPAAAGPTVTEPDDWTQQVLGDLGGGAPVAALPAPPGMSQPLSGVGAVEQPAEEEAGAGGQAPFAGFAAPSGSLFMQNLATGAVKTGMAEKAASVAASAGPALDDDFVKSAFGGGETANTNGLSSTMSSAAFSMAASAASTAAAASVSSGEAKKDTDDMFGGLVDFKNLMLDKDTRPEPRKTIR